MNKVKLVLIDINQVDFNAIFRSGLLTEEDKQQLANCRNVLIHKQKVVSSFLKRKYIGEYSYNEYGKPINQNKFFNISHSKNLVVLALASTPIGVDIEHIREYKKELESFVSSDEELQTIKEPIDFFKIWTSKEALTKCVGTGIATKLKEVPALPFEGVRTYNGKRFYSKQIIEENFVISVVIQSPFAFEIE